MSELRVLISSEWPEGGLSCPWAFFENGAAAARLGESRPEHWPAAERLVLLLASGQVSRLTARIPARLRRDGGEALAFALEDRVAENVAHLHLVASALPGTGDGEPESAITVIDRARLSRILATLTEVGCPASEAYGLHDLDAGNAECWQVRLEEGGATCDAGPGKCWHLDAGSADQPPQALVLALAQAAKAGHRPAAMAVAAEKPVHLPAWSEALGLPVRASNRRERWHQSALMLPNLLTGPYQPASSGVAWRRYRPALYILAATVALFWLAQAGQWAVDSWRLRGLDAELRAAAGTVLPQGTPLLDPKAQVRRALDETRWRRGLGESLDWQPMYAEWLKAGGGAIRLKAMSYEDHRLTLRVGANDAGAFASVAPRLAGSDLRAQWQDGPGTDATITITGGAR